MATESDRYLTKAHESLASAEADLAANRCNSAANRAYYAAFQAAVAALRREGVKPSGDWAHKFVSAQFPRRLMRERKALPSRFSDILNELFFVRLTGDYAEDFVPQDKARDAVRRAKDLVNEVETWLTRRRVSDAEVSYGVGMETRTVDPAAHVEKVVKAIHDAYPQYRTEVVERSTLDFTIRIIGNDSGVWEAAHSTTGMTSDILVDNDVWIVVLPVDNSWRDQ